MMEPASDSSIAGMPNLHPNATPLTLTASVVSQIDSSVAWTLAVVGQHDARVVVEDVEAAEPIDRRLPPSPGILFVRDVRVDEEASLADRDLRWSLPLRRSRR